MTCNVVCQGQEEHMSQQQDLFIMSTCELSIHCHGPPAADGSRLRPTEVTCRSSNPCTRDVQQWDRIAHV